MVSRRRLNFSLLLRTTPRCITSRHRDKAHAFYNFQLRDQELSVSRWGRFNSEKRLVWAGHNTAIELHWRLRFRLNVRQCTPHGARPVPAVQHGGSAVKAALLLSSQRNHLMLDCVPPQHLAPLTAFYLCRERPGSTYLAHHAICELMWRSPVLASISWSLASACVTQPARGQSGRQRVRGCMHTTRAQGNNSLARCDHASECEPYVIIKPYCYKHL